MNTLLSSYVIGVLALQGDFREHLHSLAVYGLRGVEVRVPADLKHCDALILPGGESTTIAKLMKAVGFDDAICRFVHQEKKPIWGTCAGAILLAKSLVDSVELDTSLGLVNMKVKRNAYGRQLDSQKAVVVVGGEKSEVLFIRAPQIVEYGKRVEVLSEWKGFPVFVRSGRVLASTFHSEISGRNVGLEALLKLCKR